MIMMPLGLTPQLPPYNTVISNVPGIQEKMYWNGARLDGSYPLSIVTDGIAMNITLLTYDKNVDFGIIACRRSMPQVQRLIDYMENALAELEDAAGLKTRQVKSRPGSSKPKPAARKKANSTAAKKTSGKKATATKQAATKKKPAGKKKAATKKKAAPAKKAAAKTGTAKKQTVKLKRKETASGARPKAKPKSTTQ